MGDDPIGRANQLLREKGYTARDLAVFPALHGRALLKGNRILSPFSDEPELVLRVIDELVPPEAELGAKVLRPADLRARLG
jgi:hypothetical protein